VWEDHVGSGFGYDFATGLALTGEGDVVVAGVVKNADGAATWTRRYGADGAVQWTQSVPAMPGASFYLGPDVEVAGGRVLVGFTAWTNDYNEALAAYPPGGGAPLWQRDWASGGLIYGLAAAGDDVVATGLWYPENFFVRRLSAEGESQWVSTECIGTAGRAVAVDGQGDVVAIGFGAGSDGANARLCKFTGDGQLRWGKDLDSGLGDDVGEAVVILPDGRIVVAGSQAVGPDDFDGWLAMFAP
jgi:hypothetical protein